MADYVKVIDGKVYPVIITKTFAIKGFEDQGIKIIDITEMDPQPKEGWTYSDDKFHMPITKHGIIINDKVDEVIYINEIEASFLREEGKNIINLEDFYPIPDIGWKYENGEFFES